MSGRVHHSHMSTPRVFYSFFFLFGFALIYICLADRTLNVCLVANMTLLWLIFLFHLRQHSAFTSIVYCRIFILHADFVYMMFFLILYNLTWWIFFGLRTIRESLSLRRCRLLKHIDDCSSAVAFIPFLYSASFLTSVFTISGYVVVTYIFTFLLVFRLLIMTPCCAYFANLIFGSQGNLYVLLAFNFYCIPLRYSGKSV